MGHAAPFRFVPGYEPAEGIGRFLCGTPAVLSLIALECGVETLHAADPFGGMQALREKSVALTELFIRLVDARCAALGFAVASPRDAERRGSQVSLVHAGGGRRGPRLRDHAGADRARRDRRLPFRRPGRCERHPRCPTSCASASRRCTCASSTCGDAVEHLVQVIASGEYREERFNKRAAVT
jgi:kynureninase